MCTSRSSTCVRLQPELSGKQAEDRLHEIGITVNRNAVPFDPRPPMEASGLRIGTPALATRGLQREDFAEVGQIIAAALLTGRLRAGCRRAVRASAGDRGALPALRVSPRLAASRSASRTTLAHAMLLRSMAHPTELDALYAFLVAAAVTALLTPVTMRLARAVGAIDQPRDRGLSDRPTPLLGGLAIFAGVLVAALIWLPAGYGGSATQLWHGVLLAAALITLVGALDDRFDLPPVVKLAGQVAAAVIVVHFGVAVKAITLPFVGNLALPQRRSDERRAGADRDRTGGDDERRQLLRRRRRPRRRRLRDHRGRDGGDRVRPRSRSPGCARRAHGRRCAGLPDPQLPARLELHGRLRLEPAGAVDGLITVEAAVKTTAVVSFVLPLILLAVPFLDTTFVVLKRLKYRRPIYESDSEHFHHRMARIGFSSRRTIAYLYAWTLDARRPRARAAVRPLQQTTTATCAPAGRS